jgi:hypothetical protein
LAGRRVVITLLLSVLAVLFHEFLDFPALLSDVARRVVHWATHASVITTGCLMGALVTLAPTYRGSCCCSRGSSSQRPVVVANLFLLVVLVFAATSLGNSARIGLATLPHHWGRWCVPGTALCGPGTLVCQGEKLCDIMDVMRGGAYSTSSHPSHPGEANFAGLKVP